MRLALIFDRAREDTVGLYFERAFRRTKHRVDHFWLRDAGKIPADYDVYFRIDHGDYSRDLPARLRPRAFWVSDTHLEKPFRQIARQAPSYDVVFCAMREGAQRLRQRRVEALWIPGGACDPEIHRQLPLPRVYDIGFVGSDGGIPRKFYLQELRERSPSCFLGAAPYQRIAEIYSQSKIGFNYAIRNETLTMRAFEIMACGALLLTNPIDPETLTRMGACEREHFVVYRSPDELFRLIDRYLEREEDRAAIAARGQQLALSRHTYWHRLQQMLPHLEALASRKQ